MPYLTYSNLKTKNYTYSCKTNSDCYPQSVLLKPGRYILEVYGASGGDSFYEESEAKGGKGGFSSMLYETFSPLELFLYIGGEGSCEQNEASKGGWNGGGSSTIGGCSGGGATDIRLNDCEWYDEDCLKSRIIVAGGGGGAYSGTDCRIFGSDGGGEVGGEMGERESGCVDKYHPSDDVCVATQNGCEKSSRIINNIGKADNCTKEVCSGGDGGYYGGGSGTRASSGGSGYIPPNTISSFMKSGINKGNGFVSISSISVYIYINSHKNEFRRIYLFIVIGSKVS